MVLTFTKMHGLGNDFIVVDNRACDINLDADTIRALADRHTGIGFDQLLVVEQPSVVGAEFDYRIFNADGGEVEHCGNGARCFARYVTDKGLTTSARISVNTCAGMLVLTVRSDGDVSVEMGVPTFVPDKVPFLATQSAVDKTSIEADKDANSFMHKIEVDGQWIELGVMAIGNPHAVMLVDDVDNCPIDTLGPAIESHERFPARVNVGFLEIVSKQQARLRVYERGVGETRACGSGACAALAIGVMLKKLDRSATVSLSGGDLKIHWPEMHMAIEMTGPCSTVFEGTTRLSTCKQTKLSQKPA